MTTTEAAASTTPKPRASPPVTRPAGIGRRCVRDITASMSLSYHMLIAPAAPAATAMQSTATQARTGWSDPGARTSPAGPVNTTSDITRGFNRATKARRSSAPSASVSTAKPALRRASLNCMPIDSMCRPLLDHRQLLEGVERRRRADGPLQRRRPRPPGIVADTATGGQSVDHDADEEENAGEGEIGPH